MKRLKWLPVILLFIPALNCTTINRVIWPLTPTPTPTPTPTGFPGITMPVMVQGVSLQFVSVRQVSHWLYGTTDYTPKSSSDMFLLVTANVLTSGTAHSFMKDWNVTLNSGISWVFLQSHGNINSIDSMDWVFIVSQSQSNFTIHMPGGVDVVLDSLY